jgi:hypothetical protein
MASSEGQLQVVQRLLKGGADAEAEATLHPLLKGMTVAEIAEEGGHEEVAKCLRQALDGGAGGGTGGEGGQGVRLAQQLAKAAVIE